jgi:hypothetical protein
MYGVCVLEGGNGSGIAQRRSFLEYLSSEEAIVEIGENNYNIIIKS